MLTSSVSKQIVVLGANGQLGTALCYEFTSAGEGFCPLTHQDLDLCDPKAVSDTLSWSQPHTVINTAAFTNVDAAEDSVESAFAVNCLAVRNLALACKELDALLVHLSTDYVFGGEQRTPYREGSPLNPRNVYGVSKAAGEYFVRNLCPKHLVIRTSGLYGLSGATGKGRNFVETMLRLGNENGSVYVVTDQVLSPTYTRDLAQLSRKLIEGQAQGMVHVTNSGKCSWYEFARAIFELSDIPVEVRPTTTEAFGAKAARPCSQRRGSLGKGWLPR